MEFGVSASAFRNIMKCKIVLVSMSFDIRRGETA